MDYSIISQGRQEAFQRFGPIHQLPIIRSAYDYLQKSYDGGLLLDVGAGTEKYIQQQLNLDETKYFSLDNDPLGNFTYSQVADIPAEMSFDWMVFNQVLEHLTIDQAHDLLQELRSHLRKYGQVLITVPNVAHPTRYWAETHVTPWTYAGLYALCRASGYRVLQIYRYSKNRGPMDPLSWIVERTMRRLYRIDWCDSIMLTATDKG